MHRLRILIFGLCLLPLLLHPALADDEWRLPSALSTAEKTQLDALMKPGSKSTPVASPPQTSSLTAGLNATGAFFGLPFGIGGDRIEAGYAAMSRGDIDETLRILEQGEKEAQSWSDMLLFRIAGLKADVLMRGNRALDADSVLKQSAKLENEIWSKTWISQARRGDALARRGEHPLAEGDLGRVALRLGNWSLPTSFDSMPNIQDLVFRTDAKIRSHMGLASLYARSGDYAKAMIWGSSAEEHFRNLFELAHGEYGAMVPMVPDFYIGRGENLAYLGAGILVVHKDPALAEPYFAASRAFFKAISYSFGDATTAAFKAQALYDAGLVDEFFVAAEDAVTAAAQAGLGEIVWRIEALRGRLLFKAGKLAEAEAALRRAQSAVELVSGGLSSDRAKLKFGVGKENVTKLLVAIDITKDDHATLFKDLERGRSRSFVDMLAGRQLASGRETMLVKQIRVLDRNILHQRLANASPGGNHREGLKKENALIAEWAKKNAELRVRDPELSSALSISSQELSAIQKQLGAGDVLAYVLPAEKLESQKILLVSPASARVHVLAATVEDIHNRIKVFRDAIDLDDSARQKTAANALSDTLEIGMWDAKKMLYVVPSGPFYFVPWGALTVEIPVVVLPTGGWLIRTPQNLGNSKRASIVGDPEFFGKLLQLPGARTEARQIAELYGTPPLIGEAATESRLRADIGLGVKVLHLATHGAFNAEVPLESSIVLAGQNKPSYLTAARLFEAPLLAKLIILSACETGVGKATAGDDFLGLTRSLYLGGAMTVVNSLWPIEDMGTLAFMQKFHEMAKEDDYGQAWLAARNHLRKMGFAPSIYGAFILGGAPGVRRDEQ